MNLTDSIDSVRKADVAYNRMMDSIVHSYDKGRGYVAIEKTADHAYADLPTIMAIATLVIIFGSFLVYNVLNNRFWERGIFPPFMLNRKVNRYEAVLNLAVNLIRFDRDANREKTAVLQRYLYRMFPKVHGDMSDSYGSAIAQPVTTASVCKWLKPKLTEAQRASLFNMLFEIVVCDGKIGQKEYAELLVFCRLMDVSEADLAQKVEDHKRKFAEQVHEERQKRSETISRNQTTQEKERHLSLLGLKDGYSESQLKKAYRNLVKSCHPDMTRAASTKEKELLNQRFLEIQEAYEYLSKWV